MKEWRAWGRSVDRSEIELTDERRRDGVRSPGWCWCLKRHSRSQKPADGDAVTDFMTPRTTLAPRWTIKPLVAVAVAQLARYRYSRSKRDIAVIVVVLVAVVATSIEIAVSEKGELRRIDRFAQRVLYAPRGTYTSYSSLPSHPLPGRQSHPPTTKRYFVELPGCNFTRTRSIPRRSSYAIDEPLHRRLFFVEIT